MKRLTIYVVLCTLLTGVAAAAVRGTGSVSRTDAVVRSATRTGVASRDKGTVTRSATATRSVSKNPRGAIITATERTARKARTGASSRTVSRAATNITGVPTITFDNRYEQCQNAYFTCMDQFCAGTDEKYRRCMCSPKIETVKSRERALTQAGEDLSDFQNLNITAIPKTKAEVKSMLTASDGELTLEKTSDTSDAAKKLATISDVLVGVRNNALSVAGQIDIAGDIKQIWTTTDLISGASIANLSGEALYNSVHAQCSELVMDQCPSVTTLNMVASAYGMYIENDCAALIGALDKNLNTANTAIRQVRHEMNTARLDNYNAHNSSAINECVAGVREKLTADVACGENFVHCLDLTGLYLNRATGEPIYTANFYKLDGQVSLSGDVLTNSQNAKIVAELNNRKKSAERVLDTCRDIADVVWNEFMRQAITEIYQGQQERIRTVRDQCMDVVNKCYDTTTQQLRDYSNIDDQLLLGDRLELSEKMCAQKMETCSNLYGGGTDGLELLLTEMQNITNQKIAQNCLGSLQEYAQKLCRVTSSDTTVTYPYGCRIYAPGDILYAQNPDCTYVNYSTGMGGSYANNLSTISGWDSIISPTGLTGDISNYTCLENRHYTECKLGYFLQNEMCYTCPDDYSCSGGENPPVRTGANCGNDYVGSLYQKMVVYALQYCVRPSASNEPIPTSVLENVSTVMDSIRIDMARTLASECDRIGGTWKTNFSASDTPFADFYNETNANTGWGLCVQNP
jgi:hypothetical protein